jgi:hypothetical protein
MSNFILQDSPLQNKALQDRTLKNVSEIDNQRQEVNFYKKQLQKNILALSAKQTLLIIVVSCVILFLYTSLINANLLELKEKNNQLTLSFNNLSESFNQPVEDKIRKQVLSKTLQMNELREVIAIKQRAEKVYQHHHQKNILSAHQIIEDINASVPKGMTILEVEAYNGGTQVTVNGAVEEAIAATVFLSKMRSHDQYNETDFGSLSIINVAGESSYSFALLENQLTRGALR